MPLMRQIIIKTKMDAYKKSKKVKQIHKVCYGEVVGSLNSSQQLSSVSPKQYIAQKCMQYQRIFS